MSFYCCDLESETPYMSTYIHICNCHLGIIKVFPPVSQEGGGGGGGSGDGGGGGGDGVDDGADGGDGGADGQTISKFDFRSFILQSLTREPPPAPGAGQ